MADRTAIYRYEIPVDDNWHNIPLSGAILHVATRQPDRVELWALNSGGSKADRMFRVYGTGQPIPDGAVHIGTAIIPGGLLVWHLFEFAQTAAVRRG